MTKGPKLRYDRDGRLRGVFEHLAKYECHDIDVLRQTVEEQHATRPTKYMCVLVDTESFGEERHSRTISLVADKQDPPVYGDS